MKDGIFSAKPTWGVLSFIIYERCKNKTVYKVLLVIIRAEENNTVVTMQCKSKYITFNQLHVQEPV